MRITRYCCLLALCMAGFCAGADGAPKTAAELAAAIDPASARLEPVDAQTLEDARAWLVYVTNRLEDAMRERGQSSEFPLDRKSFDPSRLLTELRSAPSDWSALVHLQEKLEIATGKIERPAELPHSVRSVHRALRSYTALLRTQTDPSEEEGELKKSLQRLQAWLKLRDPLASEETLKQPHEDVLWLRRHGQAMKLTDDIRGYYLLPKLRVHVSKGLLKELVGFPLPSYPVNRAEDGVRVSGRVTTSGRLQLETPAETRYGVLNVGFHDPLLFSGTARRGRFNLGIHAGLAFDFDKRFYIIERAPDWGPSTVGSDLQWTNSDRGCLVDRIVQKAAERGFDSAGVNAEVRDTVDNTVNAVADLVSLYGAPLVRYVSDGGDHIRERHYRTGDDGAEFVLMGVRRQEDKAEGLPPLESGADFSISIHKSIVQLIDQDLRPKEKRPISLRGVREWLNTAFEFEKSVFPEGLLDDIEIWFPPNEQFVFYGPYQGQYALNFVLFLSRTSKPGVEPFTCRVRVRPGVDDKGIVLSPVVDRDAPLKDRTVIFQILAGGQDENDRKAFEDGLRQHLKDTVRVLRVKLPLLERLPTAGQAQWQETRRVPPIRADFGKEYLSISGKLNHGS